MRLDRVRIYNYRSIADVTISLDPRCRILVGINESGKTNILKAMSLLKPDVLPDPLDVREPRPHDHYGDEAFIRFIFSLDDSEISNIYQTISPKIFRKGANVSIVSRGSKKLSLAEFLGNRGEGLYIVDLKTRKKTVAVWKVEEEFELIGRWKKPAPSCPADYKITAESGSSIVLSQLALVDLDASPEIPSDYLQDVSIEDLAELIGAEVRRYVAAHLPTCVFWTYSESSLLPGQININTFVANPDTCVPLKHMFTLAGVENIQTSIQEARARPNGLRNLLNRVAGQATRHMHQVWKEYRGIAIELSPNGEVIDAAIRDKHNLYDMSRRSDGFKRFISFLFLVSAQAKTKQLTNTLYLHDEPDTSLHPSGARRLRDELIKISANNSVVYSTHSIFMVDPDITRRHLIVEKTDEVTTVREVNESNIVDEEVIYNALGYSIFENLHKTNIVFEGWRDKYLFRVATSRWPHRIVLSEACLPKLAHATRREQRTLAALPQCLNWVGVAM